MIDHNFENGRQLYVSRLHDAKIEALVQSEAAGNYLLVGRRGSGKTATLMHVSDMLIETGREHQLIPCRPDRRFVPPMARINLVDDLYAFSFDELSTRDLVHSLNSSQNRSLNIITCHPGELERLRTPLNVSDVITIPDLLESESRELFEKLLARSGHLASDNNEYLQLIREQIGKGLLVDPRAFRFLIKGLLDESPTFRYRSPIPETQLQVARPRIITLQQNILKGIHSRQYDLKDLSPVEFENLIGELFEQDGYSVEFTQTSRDGGVDIFAWRRDIGGESLTVVQCKKFSPHNPVRVGVVREVIGTMNIHNATAAAIFTTSTFTKPAAEEGSKIKHRLSLNDYFTIMQSIARHKSEPN